MAVDEGLGDTTVEAWRIGRGIFEVVRQGDRICAEVTAQLAYVRTVVAVEARKEPSVPEEPVRTAGASARELLEGARRDRARQP